jgi:hypothetical protein|uniref:Uncharacterized protein n=1 Tax=viral metagenome TaxID=1070528 RepID=A0A6C0J0G3_9ZZZZ
MHQMTEVIVYVVHRGFDIDENGKVSGIRNPVCTRTTREDAQSICNVLNEAQEGVFFLRYVASNGFPDGSGNGTELMKKTEDTDMKTQWETIATPLRQDASKRNGALYEVSALCTKREEDAQEIRKSLREAIE